MLSVNKVSRYHVAKVAIEAGRECNDGVKAIASEVLSELEKSIQDHEAYIRNHGKGKVNDSLY